MKDNIPILYSFIRCPYAIRARIALVASQINCILREVDLKNEPEELLKTSPKGTVPVLLLPDGKIIDESLDVIYYATSQNKNLNLEQYPKQKQEEIKSLISKNDCDFVRLARPYKYPERYPDESKEKCLQEIESRFLDKYENMLDGKDFLYEQKSISDIALFPFVRQFALVDKEYFFNSHYKNIIRWLESFMDSSDFKNIVMAKNKPWSGAEEPVYLLDL